MTEPERSGGRQAIGILLAGDKSYPSYSAFCKAMQDLGYVDGETVSIRSRFAEGRLGTLPALASELLQDGVRLIAVIGAVTYFAARNAATSLPITFSIVLDPVDAGMVQDRIRPGGNTTGCSSFDPHQIAKQVAILKESIPGLKRLAVLGDASVPEILLKLTHSAAEQQGIALQTALLAAPEDVPRAFAHFTAAECDALLCLEVPRTATYGAAIVRAAADTRLPAIFGRDHARYRPLFAYGTSLATASARMAAQVDAILRGSDAGDLPIQYVVKPELVINAGAARDLGLVLPEDIVASAHEVIMPGSGTAD